MNKVEVQQQQRQSTATTATTANSFVKDEIFYFLNILSI